MQEERKICHYNKEVAFGPLAWRFPVDCGSLVAVGLSSVHWYGLRMSKITWHSGSRFSVESFVALNDYSYKSYQDDIKSTLTCKHLMWLSCVSGETDWFLLSFSRCNAALSNRGLWHWVRESYLEFLTYCLHVYLHSQPFSSTQRAICYPRLSQLQQ